MPKSIPFVDRGSSESLVQYLMRLLTAVIATYGGQEREVRISYQDLIELHDGCGFVKSWDGQKRELVLRFAAEHTEAYFRRTEEEPGKPVAPPVAPPIPISRGRVGVEESTEEPPIPIGTHIDLNKAARVVHSMLTDESIQPKDARQQFDTDNKLRPFMEK